MPSNYETFNVFKRTKEGATVVIANTVLKIYNATGGAELGTVSTNAQGIVPAGTLNVAVGTRVIFRIENYQGMAGSVAIITT